MNTEFVSQKLLQHDHKLSTIEQKLEEHDQKFDRIVQKLLEHDGQFDILREEIKENHRQVLSVLDLQTVFLQRLDPEVVVAHHRLDGHDKDISQIKGDLKLT